MKNSKIEVQIFRSYDCEGRYWKWVRTTKTYERAKSDLEKDPWNGWIERVRMIERVYTEEAAKPVVRVLKTATKHWVNGQWIVTEVEG